jgi:hypothetical protein
VPQQILLQPDRLEYGRYREQYEALAAELEGEGEGVLVRVLPAMEERGLPTGTENIPEFYDLAIQVGAFAGAIVSTARLVQIVRGRLRGREGRDGEKRRAKIYLANGEEHEFIFGDEYD